MNTWSSVILIKNFDPRVATSVLEDGHSISGFVTGGSLSKK